MTKYYISQVQNGKTIIYGDFNANSLKEAVFMACNSAKKVYPHYNRKTPFKVKKYGEKTKEVCYE